MSHIQFPIALMRITQFSFRQPPNSAQLVPTISAYTPSMTGILAFFRNSVLVDLQPCEALIFVNHHQMVGTIFGIYGKQ